MLFTESFTHYAFDFNNNTMYSLQNILYNVKNLENLELNFRLAYNISDDGLEILSLGVKQLSNLNKISIYFGNKNNNTTQDGRK